MSLLALIVLLAVIGFLTWLVTNKIPMDPTIKGIIVVVAIIVCVVILLQAFGIMDSLRGVRVPQL